jgi:hypothetical protein
MPTLDARFQREPEIFRTEAEQCAQFLFAFLAVHDCAYRIKAVRALLNRAPLFWNTCLGALQASAFIALGHVFDSDSPHNVNQLRASRRTIERCYFRRLLSGGENQPANPNDRTGWTTSCRVLTNRQLMISGRSKRRLQSGGESTN